MDLVDDTQLVIMARKPPVAMFSFLRQTRPYLPLLALLSILPCLYALVFRHYDEVDSLWGLRALETTTIPWETRLLHPPKSGAEGLLSWQPPQGTWVTAALIQITRSTSPFLLMAVSFLGTAASIAMFVTLIRVAVSDRAAVWCALIVAFQFSVLALAGRFSGSSLALFTALAALWGFLAHLERGRRGLSLRLAIGGVALGLCLLVGGPIALGVVVILLLHTLGLRGESLSRRRWAGPRTVLVWAGWPALKSLLMLVVIAGLVGAWWPIVRWRQSGADFLGAWFFGTVVRHSTGIPAFELETISGNDAPNAAIRLLMLIGPMSGLILLGTFRALIAVLVSPEEPRRRSQQFLLLWALVGGLVFWDLFSSDDTWPHYRAQWEALFAMSLAGIGAVAIEDVMLRRVPLWHLVTVTGLASALSFAAALQANSLLLLRQSITLSWAMAIAGILVIAWKWFFRGIDKDFRHRALLTTLVLVPLAGSIVLGCSAARRATSNDDALEAFRRELPSAPPISDAMIIGSARHVPLRIRLAIQSAWPRSKLEFVDSWEMVLARSVSADPAEGQRTVLAVDWIGRIGRPANLQAAGIHIAPLGSLQFFEGGPLRAYVIRREAQPAPKRKTLSSSSRFFDPDRETFAGE